MREQQAVLAENRLLALQQAADLIKEPDKL